jgi:3'-phosphoadenosine 5'-phosphosulfate sulfotransferase (PAPS reductase)/FAD synthetase
MIVASVSGGKDSVGMLIRLCQQYGAREIVAHHQVLWEDWSETVPYVHDVCARLGVALVCQQMLYTPDETGRATMDGRCVSIKRLAVVDVRSECDVVPAGTPGVLAGVTDLALRRRWPPSAVARFCTSWLKVDLLDYWIAQHREKLGTEILVALGERAAESPRRARKPEKEIRKQWKKRVPGTNRWEPNITVWNWLPVHAQSRRDMFRR